MNYKKQEAIQIFTNVITRLFYGMYYKLNLNFKKNCKDILVIEFKTVYLKKNLGLV